MGLPSSTARKLPMPQDYKPPSRLLAFMRGDVVFWVAVALIVVSLAVWAVQKGG